MQADEHQHVLVGRTFENTQDGGTLCTFSVGCCHASNIIVAYIYNTDIGQPSDVTECEWIGADELLEADWAEWVDGRLGRSLDDADNATGSDEVLTLKALFSDLELTLANSGVGLSNDDDASSDVDDPLPTISTTVELPSQYPILIAGRSFLTLRVILD